MTALQKPVAPPLPDKASAWIRKIGQKRTLNDLVEDVHMMLVEQEDYLAFLEAIYDEQAVEGSLSADNIMAAMSIRNKAKELGSTELAREKLATISKALGVVLRRYGESRFERKNMVRGEIVPVRNGE